MQNTEDLTPEQIQDISDREAKGLQALRDLQLTPAANLTPVNLGNDVFGFKLTPFLMDTKLIAPEKAASVPSTDPEVNPTL